VTTSKRARVLQVIVTRSGLEKRRSAPITDPHLPRDLHIPIHHHFWPFFVLDMSTSQSAMSDGSGISAAQHKRNSISPSPLTPQSNIRSSAPTSLHERHVNRNSYFTSVSQSAQSVCPITTNIHNPNKLYDPPLFPPFPRS
jgi:hypothetical protein